MESEDLVPCPHTPSTTCSTFSTADLFKFYFSKIRFNIVLSFSPMSHRCSIRFWFSGHTFPLHFYIFRLYHPSWLNQSNKIATNNRDSISFVLRTWKDFSKTNLTLNGTYDRWTHTVLGLHFLLDVFVARISYYFTVNISTYTMCYYSLFANFLTAEPTGSTSLLTTHCMPLNTILSTFDSPPTCTNYFCNKYLNLSLLRPLVHFPHVSPSTFCPSTSPRSELRAQRFADFASLRISGDPQTSHSSPLRSILNCAFNSPFFMHVLSWQHCL
jgi:hypothetical protein